MIFNIGDGGIAMLGKKKRKYVSKKGAFEDVLRLPCVCESLREDGGKRVTKNRMWYQLGLKLVLVCFYWLIYVSMVHGNGHSHCNICLLRGQHGL